MAPKFEYTPDVIPGVLPISVVSHSDFGALARLGIPELTREAFRFYAFTNAWVRKHDWPAFGPDAVDRAVYVLRFAFHEALKHKVHGLWLRPDLRKFVKPETLRYVGTNRRGINWLFLDQAQKAILTARVFVSAAHRLESFVESGRARPRDREYGGIHLDRIATRLRDGRGQLHALFDPQRRPAVPDQSVAFTVKGRAMNYRAFGGRNRAGPGAVELTEHLYVVLGSDRAFGDDRDKPVRKGTNASRLNPEYDDLRATLSAWQRTLDSLGVGIVDGAAGFLHKSLRPFKEWSAALDVLEARFAYAAQDTNANLATRFGLPWSLRLVYLLRWYLADIQIRTLMTALPTYAFYDGPWKRTRPHGATFNAYLGLALYEALTGKPLRHVSIDGLLDFDFPVGDAQPADGDAARDHAARGYVSQTKEFQLVGRSVHDWPALAQSSIFGELDSRHVTESFSRWPVIAGFSAVDGKRRKQRTESVDGTPMELADAPEAPPAEGRVYSQFGLMPDPYWIAGQYPLIHRISGGQDGGREPGPDFYRSADLLPNPAASQLNVAATYDAQLRLFVASALLRRVSGLFGLDSKYPGVLDSASSDTPQSDMPEGEEGDEPDPRWDCARYGERLARDRQSQLQTAVPRFRLGSGSYAYGGSFAPHKTHATGDVYDVSLGPDVVHWPLLRSTLFLDIAYEIFDKLGIQKRETQFCADLDPDGSYRGVRPLYEVHHYTGRRWCEANMLADIKTLGRLKDEALDGIAGRLDEEAWQKAETRLIGTPHFESAAFGELAHIGHLCLLISAPSRIIYASPIVHLRALRALTRTANTLGEVYRDLAVTLAAKRRFVFLPHDHYDHWHVEYSSSLPPNAPDLWLCLGIDLRPFREYLRAHVAGVHRKDVPGSYAAGPVGETYQRALEFCSSYADQFETLYPDARVATAGSTDMRERRTEADAVTRDLFGAFVDAPLHGQSLAPAVPRNRQESGRHFVADRDAIARHLREIYGLFVDTAASPGMRLRFAEVVSEMHDETTNPERKKILGRIRQFDLTFLEDYMYQLFSAGRPRAFFGQD